MALSPCDAAGCRLGKGGTGLACVQGVRRVFERLWDPGSQPKFADRPRPAPGSGPQTGTPRHLGIRLIPDNCCAYAIRHGGCR